MNIENRYDKLIDEHRLIEAKLAAEMKRPLPDGFVLQRLKRKKLLLKDEIESWERLLGVVKARPAPPPHVLHA